MSLLQQSLVAIAAMGLCGRNAGHFRAQTSPSTKTANVTAEMLHRLQTLNNVQIKIKSRMRDLSDEMTELQVKLNLDGSGPPRELVRELVLSALIVDKSKVEAELARTRLLGEPQETLQSLKARLELRQKQINNAKAELAEFSNNYLRYLHMQDEHRGLREKFRTVNDQIQHILSPALGNGAKP